MLTPTRTVALATMSALNPAMLLGIVTVKSSNGTVEPLPVGAKRPVDRFTVPLVDAILRTMFSFVTAPWLRCEGYKQLDFDTADEGGTHGLLNAHDGAGARSEFLSGDG